MKGLVLSTVSSLIIFSGSSFGCLLGTSPPLLKFDRTEYVFIGNVVGYTSPSIWKETNQGLDVISLTHMGERSSRQAIGLIVSLKERVFLPKVPENYFDVYPFILWADCSITGTSLDDLKKKFPINSEVRVIAKETQHISSNAGSDLQLELWPTEWSMVDVNTITAGSQRISADSIFNYEEYNRSHSRDDMDVSMLHFEIRKDLVRLQLDKTDREKKAIIERLLYVSPYGNADIDYEALFRTYLKGEKEIRAFINRRKRIEKRLYSRGKHDT